MRASLHAGAGASLQACATPRDADPDEPSAPSHAHVIGLRAPALERVRVGVIGTGARGQVLTRLLAGIEGVELRALCDVDARALAAATKLGADAGRGTPLGFGERGDDDYLRMLDTVELDLAIVATPWRFHVPMTLAALERGVHAGVEVPIAYTLDDCWAVIEAAERTRVHCMMLENVCYGRLEMMTLQMVAAGLFGELTHGEGAYIHNLSGQLGGTTSESLWRPAHHLVRDGNLYPTHGLGPIAQCMGIHAGDRLASLVSMSSPALGRKAHALRALGPDAPEAKLDYRCGDINTSIIKTARGRTILVQHDTTTPRPYTRIHHIQGTRGALRGFPGRVALVDAEHGGHEWLDADRFQAEYDHPLWRRHRPEATGHADAHGGMDYVMLARLIEQLRAGEAMDMSVYDGVAWSSVSPLSEASVAAGGAPVEVPDFTRGAWRV